MAIWDDIRSFGSKILPDEIEDAAGSFGRNVTDFVGVTTPKTDERARGLMQQADDLWSQLGAGAPTAQDLTPQLGFLGGPAASSQVYADRGSLQAQQNALNSLANLSREGFTNAERDMLGEARRQADMQARGQREAALQALAAQGLTNSGANLAARLSAGQAAANRGASLGAQAMMGAQNRAMRGAALGGQLGSQMRAQGFNEAMSRARATDDRNLYNNQIRNQAAQARAAARQQDFQNRMAVTGNRANLKMGRGQFEATRKNPLNQQLEVAGQIMRIT